MDWILLRKLVLLTPKKSHLLLPRALENLLDTGEVGIHEFANSVYAVAGHGEEQEMEVKGSMEEMSDNATNCSDSGGNCSDESYEGETADFEGSGFGQQRSQYSFFGGRHGPPSPR